jgi:hypothetical protein
MNPVYQALEPFLQQFFGEGNELTWDMVQFGSLHPRARDLEPFLQQATEDWDRLLLPRLQEEKLTWYAFARDARGARLLRDELLAFVGPSYTDFRGQSAIFDAQDPVEGAILAALGPFGFRLTVVDRKQRPACREALTRFLQVHGRSPRGLRGLPRPPGRILRDFEFAVQNQARDVAQEYLRELEEQGGTSARNLWFLQVYLHESFEEWERLNTLLEQGALVQAERPSRVTRALIRAVYRQELWVFETANRPEAALAHFEQVVYPRFSPLYTSLVGLQGPEVIKSFLLAAAVADPPLVDRRFSLLEIYPRSAPDRPYVERLASLIPERANVPPPLTPLEAAQRAFAQGDLDAAFRQLLALPPSVVGLDLLLRCALEVGGLEATAKALEWLEAAPAVHAQALQERPRLHRLEEQLHQRFASLPGEPGKSPPVSPAVPPDWVAWARRLKEEPSWAGATAVAAQGALEWSVEAMKEAPEQIQALRELLLEGLAPAANGAVLDALPHLLEFFVRRLGSERAFAPIYEVLFDRLLYLEPRTIEAIRAAGELLMARMRLGMTQEEGCRALQDLQEVWQGQSSFELLDGALDLLDFLLTQQPVPLALQQGFAQLLFGELIRWRERLNPTHLPYFQQLCRELGLPIEARSFEPEDADPVPTVHPLAALISGRKVALYSLRDAAVQRAARVLVQLVPEVELRVYHDTVGNEALKAAAKTADIFVIVTGAATHAATTFIEMHRPKERLTLRCHATGTGGLLRTLLQACPS